MEGETVYGSQDDSGHGVMSERVQTLARNIYQELQRMIQKHDEDLVKVNSSFFCMTDFCKHQRFQTGSYAKHCHHA
jgi:hypothetical protein